MCQGFKKATAEKVMLFQELHYLPETTSILVYWEVGLMHLNFQFPSQNRRWF
jgi:hypothetical protein